MSEFVEDAIRIPWLCRWWFSFGLRMGWISDVMCVTHNGLPYTEAEEGEFDGGGDPCVAVCRVWSARQ